MDCQFVSRDGVWVCEICGFVYRPRGNSPKAPHRNCPSKLRADSGDVLHYLIHVLFHEKPSCKCGCTELQQKMNAWGWRCVFHLGEIAGHMQAEAEKRGWRLAKKLPRTTQLVCCLLVLIATAIAIVTTTWRRISERRQVVLPRHS